MYQYSNYEITKHFITDNLFSSESLNYIQFFILMCCTNSQMANYRYSTNKNNYKYRTVNGVIVVKH
jgi:hypothetical protein